MNILKSIAILLVCVVSSLAQTAGQRSHHIKVVKFNWYNDSHPRGWDAPYSSATKRELDDVRSPSERMNIPASTDGESGSPTSRPNPIVDNSGQRPAQRPVPRISYRPLAKGVNPQYVYRVKVRNEGEKTAEAFDWEYLFIDPATSKVLATHSFQNFARAKPSKYLTLSGISVAPPSKVISATMVNKNERAAFVEKVVIKCVAYTDGTAQWQEAGEKSDCERLAQQIRERRR